MANAPKRTKKQSNVYKTGKLSKNNRFSTNGVNWTVVIVTCSILASFVFAVILGAMLGNKAHSSQNTTTEGGSSSSITPPVLDKVSPHSELNAYFADMTNADPNASLSEQTGAAREAGNALFFYLRTDDGKLIYSSTQAKALDFSYHTNLTLDRLSNHLAYYDDYAVGLFESDFSAALNTEARMIVQTNEALLLAEATKSAFSQIIIEFSDEINKDNAAYYYTYLMNVKLACPGASIGIKLPYIFAANADNAGIMAELLGIVDFYALDLGALNTDEISSVLSPLAYFTQRYGTVVMLDTADTATLADRILALKNRGVNSYIVK